MKKTMKMPVLFRLPPISCDLLYRTNTSNSNSTNKNNNNSLTNNNIIIINNNNNNNNNSLTHNIIIIINNNNNNNSLTINIINNNSTISKNNNNNNNNNSEKDMPRLIIALGSLCCLAVCREEASRCHLFEPLFVALSNSPCASKRKCFLLAIRLRSLSFLFFS